MKLFLKSILIASFVPLFFPQGAWAQEYAVQPVIFIAPNYKDEGATISLDQHKQTILTALEEIRQWYAKQLNGKTFNIIKSVRVVNSSTFDPNYTQLVPREDKTVNIVYMVGMGGKFAGSWGYEKTAALGYDVLLDLYDKGRGDSLGALAHELGHSFGLVETRWAGSHPCTVISLENCKLGDPDFPSSDKLPPAEEWSSGVMGSGNHYYPAPYVKFNNSIINAEIWKAYQTPYLNPRKDPAPNPNPYKDKERVLKQGKIIEI